MDAFEDERLRYRRVPGRVDRPVLFAFSEVELLDRGFVHLEVVNGRRSLDNVSTMEVNAIGRGEESLTALEGVIWVVMMIAM